jgi:multidrug resistance efflux pump
MTDLVQLIQDADFAHIEMENARSAVEAAKAQLEAAKENFESSKFAFDQVIARADEVGVPRAKLRKLVEERAAVLAASGLISTPVNPSANRTPKPPKPPKKKASKAVEESGESGESGESDFDASSTAHEEAVEYAN